ncbi:MAG: type II secretion system protein GspG [Gemmatimonadetes bacterium]|nr:type II secretion system protein GspG [Gemmatimonadota bacterium]
MLKIILVIAVLIGAALYFPRTRPIVLDAAAPVIDPVLSWQTRGEMNQLARDLEQRERASRHLPNPRTQWPPAWIEREYQGGDATVDAWGTPYTYQLGRDSFTLTSFGPDAERGTDDDIVVTRERIYPAR